MTKPRKVQKEALERGAADYSRPEPRTLLLLWIEGWEEFLSSQAMHCRADSSPDAQGRWSLFQLLTPLANRRDSLLIASEHLPTAEFLSSPGSTNLDGKLLGFLNSSHSLSFSILYKKIIDL